MFIMEKITSIVFTGDSVTDCFRENAETAPYGNGYVNLTIAQLICCFPNKKFNFVNTGISGNRSSDLLERFEKDVINHNPNIVTICIGINDVLRKYSNGDGPVDIETYERNVENMINQTLNKTNNIILLSPYVVEPNKENPMLADMIAYGQVCEKLSKKYNLKFIDLQKCFNEYLKDLNFSIIAPDLIHPSIVGHTIISNLALEKLEKFI